MSLSTACPSAFTLSQAHRALDDPVAVAALVVGAMILLYILVLRPRGRQGTRPDPLAIPPGRRASLASERSAERQMQMLLVELEKMSRQMSAQMDTRAARLEALIREADAKIASLNTAHAQARAANLTDRLITGTLGDGAESGLAALSRHREIYDLADAGATPRDIATKLHRPAGEIELILALRGTGGIS